MGRSPCCAKEGLNRGAWTAMEDKTLTEYIKLHGEGRWRGLPKRAGLKRCGKSCRLRWLNYLRPDIKRGNIGTDEEELIIRLHKLLGNRWSLIAGRLPGRTDNEIKNYWNTNLGKKLQDHRKVSNTKTTTKPSATTEAVQPPGQSGNVVPIRTKAVKYTRAVVIGSPPPRPPPAPPLPLPLPPPTPAPVTCKIQVAGPTPDADADADTNTNTNTSSLAGEGPLEDFSALDLSMMGELNLSEFLNSPYLLDMFQEGGGLSPSSSKLEEPIFFPEEMMEDWRRSGCGGIDGSVVEYLLGE